MCNDSFKSFSLLKSRSKGGKTFQKDTTLEGTNPERNNYIRPATLITGEQEDAFRNALLLRTIEPPRVSLVDRPQPPSTSGATLSDG
ncbi:malic enzyme NAD binding domain protein [Anopheles sinensis]|uniref:Malic enzyme NAD binding domain protein n=1 Tax=Anopheles sinensis TaxID=74873 RepID=A0A084WIC5_ANOSI|nr:malic enzyme NAD binding domain protein [Anopheles sinensis]